jgi:pimeloyl-ACP methyl ester carboxylesterase
MAENNATASSRARKLPIIIVPGTMGSRLVDPLTNETVWNPLGFPTSIKERGSFAAKLARLERVDQPLVADTTQPTAADVAHIRNFHTVIRQFYGETARTLHTALRKRLAAREIFPVIYCAGYDFRVDNAISARTLAAVVDQAQAECDGEQVIIIAHSMGGIVTRFFCKNMGGESRVKRVFLLASPTHGAPDAYFALRNGLEFSKVRLFVFGDVLKATNSRKFARRMPSVYQLLPTFAYSAADPNWLAVDRAKTGIARDFQPAPIPSLQFSDASNPALVYIDMYAGLADDPEFTALSDRLVAEAQRFEGSLQTAPGRTYFHPNTTVVFTDDMNTIMRGRVDFIEQTTQNNKTTVRSRAIEAKEPAGDETVPAISAAPDRTDPAPALRKKFSNVTHQQVPADRGVVDFLIDEIAAAP